MSGNSLRWAAKLAYLELLRRVPDRLAVSFDYFRVFGRFPNLANPQLFSEKMQHFKLDAHDARAPELVDKVEVKKYVSKALGDRWLIPTLWHGEEVTEEVLREVPKPAVMKANHSSAQIIFLKDHSNLREAARTANGWRDYDHHMVHREWAYGNVKRQILIEPFIGDQESPDDYKFWVVDGDVRFIQVDHARFRKHTHQFYTDQWKRLDLKMNYPAAPELAPKPPHLDEMLDAAKTLARGFRFLRVDLYDTAKGPLFGELTFTPEAGLCRFEPADFDRELGESWSYPARPSEAEQLKPLSDAFKLRDRKT